MQLARITGTVVATQKSPDLRGFKIFLLQPLNDKGRPVGGSLVGIDSVGAGVGEEVFFVRGREASLPFLPRLVPTDASIIGIVDQRSLDRTSPMSKLGERT